MSWLFIACLLLNAFDAVGTWYGVGVGGYVWELNPVAAWVIATCGWPWFIVIKIAVCTAALWRLYQVRNQKPTVIKGIFVAFTVVFGLLAVDHIAALILHLTGVT